MEPDVENAAEAAIAQAYAAAKQLYYRRCPPEKYASELDHYVAGHETPAGMIRYVRIGFTAGFFGRQAPDALGANSGIGIRLALKHGSDAGKAESPVPHGLGALFRRPSAHDKPAR